MQAPYPRSRIFVLGAGFSKPAGLPLGEELFSAVRKLIEERYGKNTKFQRDLEYYIRYRSVCDGLVLQEDTIDLEGFMSFLDIEHFLGLRGSDTWSREGNESQLMVRMAIGEVIQSRTPPANQLPDFYYRFADQLSIADTVFTFNYDVILERAFEHIGKPYRLFPHRFSAIGRFTNIVDSDADEVPLLKLHGSVDWFDDRSYLELTEDLRAQGSIRPPIHSVFNNKAIYGVYPLVDGLRSENDPLIHIHRIRNVDAYYAHSQGMNAPFILSPSHVKFVYSEPLASFWDGMGRAGGWNSGISVIGFSLPKHDEYIRIGLFQMISNYQRSRWDSEIVPGIFKDNVRIVDFQDDEKGIASLKSNYSFVDLKKADYFFDGFGNDAIEFLFSDTRVL
jgi:hypothetical protein